MPHVQSNEKPHIADAKIRLRLNRLQIQHNSDVQCTSKTHSPLIGLVILFFFMSMLKNYQDIEVFESPEIAYPYAFLLTMLLTPLSSLIINKILRFFEKSIIDSSYTQILSINPKEKTLTKSTVEDSIKSHLSSIAAIFFPSLRFFNALLIGSVAWTILRGKKVLLDKIDYQDVRHFMNMYTFNSFLVTFLQSIYEILKFIPHINDGKKRENIRKIIDKLLKAKLNSSETSSEINVDFEFPTILVCLSCLISGTLNEYLRSPTFLNVPLSGITSYRDLPHDAHLYFIIACLLKKYLTDIDVVALDSDGNQILEFKSKLSQPNANQIINEITKDLDKINENHRILKKNIQKLGKQKISLQLIKCFSETETENYNDLFKIKINSDNIKEFLEEKKIFIDEESCISSEIFLKAFDELKKNFSNQKNESQNHSETEGHTFSRSNPVPWFFDLNLNPRKTPKKGRKKVELDEKSENKLGKEAVKEEGISFQIGNNNYVCPEDMEIKLIYNKGNNPILAIFRVSQEMFDEKDAYNRFKNIFKNKNQIQGKHGNCFKGANNLKYPNEKKFSTPPKWLEQPFEIPCVLHENSNTRVIALDSDVKAKSVNFNGQKFETLPVYDFCGVDEKFHSKGKNNTLSKSEVTFNEESLMQYLEKNCTVENIDMKQPQKKTEGIRLRR